jgi:hypothetical protein
MNLPQSSGRVSVTKHDNFNLFKLYQETSPNKYASEEAIKSIHTQNDISTIFFSRENIDALQDSIRYLVYTKSCKKHTIDKQSENDLLIIMRSIYLQYAEHKPYNILDQIKVLNLYVVEYCVPKILEEINIYLYYRKDISQLPMPMERGEFISAKGNKVLEQRF